MVSAQRRTCAWRRQASLDVVIGSLIRPRGGYAGPALHADGARSSRGARKYSRERPGSWCIMRRACFRSRSG